ncbi:hypothetical protein PFNF135_01153 [Plasmodium falciparum NF135/5.C10]|uniref:Uncharacterized protein n=1 Tax=Plasmodium falciparum NF135/5.C10 TaxID=1036726 RepID=W4INH1_PLAFA|nr:hypothetical protein PFNF135_01153 [Plasmodium falciparum NF135/5.C10]
MFIDLLIKYHLPLYFSNKQFSKRKIILLKKKDNKKIRKRRREIYKRNKYIYVSSVPMYNNIVEYLKKHTFPFFCILYVHTIS